jgi:glycosyltransferase involved in cell wall biosynthesis
MHSIVLTVHNKDWLLSNVLDGIVKNTIGDYELVVVLDGCTDKSEEVWENFISNNSLVKTKTVYTPDVFETKANNAGLKECVGDKVIIVQDDMVIKEDGWNKRLEKPFDEFVDVFAVTARSAFNYRFNQNSQHIHLSPEEDSKIDNCWSDIFEYESHINRDEGLSRNIFAVRNNVNRGPLMIDHSDLIVLDYFDEIFSPQDQDDADLCYRAFKHLGKVVGSYWIDYDCDNAWGGTRPDGKNPAPWLLKAHHKNTRIVFDRHKNIILTESHDENRVLK